MRTDARWARPPEYRVLGDPHQVLLRDDQSIDLHRVALRGRLQTYLRAMRGTLWWHVFDLRTLLGSRPLAQELQVQLSTAFLRPAPELRAARRPHCRDRPGGDRGADWRSTARVRAGRKGWSMTCKTCGGWDVTGPSAAPPGAKTTVAMCMDPSSPHRGDLTWSHEICRAHQLRQDDILCKPAASGATTGYSAGTGGAARC